MRVLIDTDAVLDFLLARHEFVMNATAIWQANIDGRIDAYISAITPVNVFYIARKLKDAATAYSVVSELMAKLRVCDVNSQVLNTALVSPLRDYEDAVQHACATEYKLDAIVTRNLEDYRDATIPVFSPQEFLQNLDSSQ